ncbi:NAD(P)H-dependent flavin oxidoreductase [Pseudoalteromonas mariniglutinosa]|uniref:NAD(P)H-dependent flavin oxidoreductase n=1 Tax=Pseudoalteromonas mariniglutinosa TaxID=206042 RepID=UPI00384F77A0
MFNTLFATQYPLIQAPMAGVQDAVLAVAVCEAGGLGSLPCAMLTNEQLTAQLEYITQATNKPYNVNFFCHQTPQYTKAQRTQWHALLKPYFSEFAINPKALSTMASRQPINQHVVDLIAPYKPPVVSFHFGLPAAAIVAQIKRWGAKVIASATTLQEAQWLVEHGADAIIAQGLEAGGHRGHFLSSDLSLQLSTAELVKACTKLAVPVIAAGGIASAADVKYYLQLGAAAVQVGSAYLLCEEATTSALHRDAILQQPANSTVLTTVFSGRAARGIENRIMRELGAMPQQAPAFPFASLALSALRAKSEAQGKSDFSPLWCGQKYIVRDAVSAAEITEELVSGNPKSTV